MVVFSIQTFSKKKVSYSKNKDHNFITLWLYDWMINLYKVNNKPKARIINYLNYDNKLNLTNFNCIIKPLIFKL
jgi:hypothetical protein